MCMQAKVFCGLHVAHVRIVCPVRDVAHVRKCTRPSPALPYCDGKLGEGLGTRLPFRVECCKKHDEVCGFKDAQIIYSTCYNLVPAIDHNMHIQARNWA